MKKFLAVICVLIIVVILPLTLIGTIAKQRLLTATAFKQLLRTTGVAEQLPQLLITAWQKEMASDDKSGENQNNPLLAGLAANRTQRLLEQALPPKDFYAITDGVIDVVATWWHTNDRIEELPLVLDLGVIKENFTPVVANALELYLEKLPVCTDEQLASLEYGEDGLPSIMGLECKPADLTLSSYRDQGWSDHLFAQIFLFAIPTEIDIGEILQKQAAENPEMMAMYNQRVDDARGWAVLAKRILWAAWLIIGLCLVGLMLLRHRPIFAMFGWVGATSGIVTVECAVLAGILWVLPQSVTPWLDPSTDPTMIEFVNKIISALALAVAQPLLWISLGLALLSIVCLSVRAVLKHKATAA